MGTDEVRCAPDFVAFQDGKSPPLDLAERDRIRGFCISQRTLTSARLGLADRLNLDFHVAAVDHHPIARDSLARGRPHDSTGFEIKIRSMPRTGYVGSCYRPFREGPAAMSAGVWATTIIIPFLATVTFPDCFGCYRPVFLAVSPIGVRGRNGPLLGRP